MYRPGTSSHFRNAVVVICAAASICLLASGCKLRRDVTLSESTTNQTPLQGTAAPTFTSLTTVDLDPQPPRRDAGIQAVTGGQAGTDSQLVRGSLASVARSAPTALAAQRDSGPDAGSAFGVAAKRDAPLDPPLDPSMAWIKNVGIPQSARSRSATRHAGPAPRRDKRYASSDTVPVRRLVYRVRFVVPRYFRAGKQTLRPGAAELHIDVGHDRLRARFVGRGWPVHEGSEIRLRSDAPGVYLFDGFGGRSLGPGDMATWFDGRIGAKPKSHVRVHRNFGKASEDDPGPGALVCALLAEWTHQPRENLEGRCRRNATPPGFRLGPWSAELTAILPMRLPRTALRADNRDPPEGLDAQHSRAMLSPVELNAIEPNSRTKTATNAHQSPSQGPRTGLTVRNDADARLIILGSGVPLGWVDAGHTVNFPIRTGSYRIGAMRPLGIVRRRATRTHIPSTVAVTAPRGSRKLK